MKNLFLLLLLLLLVFPESQAQPSSGKTFSVFAHLGGGISLINPGSPQRWGGQVASGSVFFPKANPRPMLSIGGGWRRGFGSPFYLAMEYQYRRLNLHYKGAGAINHSIYGTSFSTDLLYIVNQIHSPLFLGYHLGTSTTFHFFVGPDFTMTLNSRHSGSYIDDQVELSADEYRDTPTKMQLGISGGIAVEIPVSKQTLEVQLRIGHSLSKLFDFPDGRSFTAQLGLAYRFDLIPAKQ